MCDAMYMTEVQNVCQVSHLMIAKVGSTMQYQAGNILLKFLQDNGECLMNARDNLMGLRNMYEQDFIKSSRRLTFGSCLSNPCIQRYFLNSPGAIYPMEA